LGVVRAGDNEGATTIADGTDRGTFLKLLVAQMRNQDPLSPQDPTAFVSQLAQFSSLEALLNMQETLQKIQTQLAGPGGNEE
jgi:flagellar basal-body rod modification protein FlgD